MNETEINRHKDAWELTSSQWRGSPEPTGVCVNCQAPLSLPRKTRTRNPHCLRSSPTGLNQSSFLWSTHCVAFFHFPLAHNSTGFSWEQFIITCTWIFVSGSVSGEPNLRKEGTREFHVRCGMIYSTNWMLNHCFYNFTSSLHICWFLKEIRFFSSFPIGKALLIF